MVLFAGDIAEAQKVFMTRVADAGSRLTAAASGETLFPAIAFTNIVHKNHIFLPLASQHWEPALMSHKCQNHILRFVQCGRAL